MKTLHVITLTGILLALPTAAAVGQVKHPNLLFNRQELADQAAFLPGPQRLRLSRCS